MRSDRTHCDGKIQQLEKGTYQLPDASTCEAAEGIEITASQLSLILDGIDLLSVTSDSGLAEPASEFEIELLDAVTRQRSQ